MSTDPATDLRLRAELQNAWQNGHSLTVEDLLEQSRHPQLDHQSLLALVYTEYCFRKTASEPVSHQEFLQRFPGLADGLEPLLQSHGSCAVGQGGHGDTRSSILVLDQSNSRLTAKGVTIAVFCSRYDRAPLWHRVHELRYPSARSTAPSLCAERIRVVPTVRLTRGRRHGRQSPER
jgi:hypothetical protein